MKTCLGRGIFGAIFARGALSAPLTGTQAGSIVPQSAVLGTLAAVMLPLALGQVGNWPDPAGS